MAAMGELLPLSALSPLGTQSQPYETDPEMDRFLNLEATMQSPSVSPSNSDVKSTNLNFVHHQQQQVPPMPSVSSSQQQQHFPAPSQQYGSYTQQTGLPPGGLASTMAINQVSPLGFGYDTIGMPHMDSIYGRVAPPQLHTLSALPLKESEMEVDDSITDSQAYLMPSQAVKTQFVDPNALGCQEMTHSPSATANQARRVYPGIHQQQAARAKAAQQQRQEMLHRQQQQQTVQQQQTPQQQETLIGGNQQRSRSQVKSNRNNDPALQERISRLLQQMRQSSVSSQDDADQSNSLPQPSKYRKDEQDMDEDERLLASEEGKKLSSKERRQLRNKVSARAFRSRRKEYIGQLEGEVAAKTNEANELRLRNNALAEENARLSSFTRMLLSSSHFTPLLNELSANGLPPSLTGQSQDNSAPPLLAGPTASKEESGFDLSQEISLSNTQTSLPAVAEQTFDFNAMDVNDGWNSGLDYNYSNPSVFAVFDVPVGPSLDLVVPTGKNLSCVGPLLSDNTKDFVPTIPYRNSIKAINTTENRPIPSADLDIDESDPLFALYLDQTPTVSSQTSSNDFVSNVQPENSCSGSDLILVSSITSGTSDDKAATCRDLERLCAALEPSFKRVSQLTAHLD